MIQGNTFCHKCGQWYNNGFSTGSGHVCINQPQHYQNPFNQPLITPGWQCPKCTSIYSPTTPECCRCNSRNTATITLTDTPIIITETKP